MRKIWHDEAWEEYLYWQEQDKKTLRNGYNCIGKPEKLSDNLSGFWSARIDEKNRIVFRIVGDMLEIAECGSHYGDK